MLTLRHLIRTGLVIVFVLSVAVVVAALVSGQRGDLDTWAAVAAALAVISSVLSAWSAQRVLEIQEDSRSLILTLLSTARAVTAYFNSVSGISVELRPMTFTLTGIDRLRI